MNIINNTGSSSTIIKNNINQSKVIKISKINGKPENEFFHKESLRREKYIYDYIISNKKGDLVFYSQTYNDSLKLLNFRSLGYIPLYEYIRNNKNENSIIKKNIFKKLLELHSIGVYHRDLHRGNIIIKNNDNTDIKFIDFGLSIIDNDLYKIDHFLLYGIMFRYFYQTVSIDYLNFINLMDDHLKKVNHRNPNKFIILSLDSDELENLKRLLKYNDILTVQINLLTEEDTKIVDQFFPEFTSIEKAKETLQIVNNLFGKQESELNENEKSFVLLFNNIFYGFPPFILPTETNFNSFITLISNTNPNNMNVNSNTNPNNMNTIMSTNPNNMNVNLNTNSNSMNVIINNTKNNQVSNYLLTNKEKIINYIEKNLLDELTSGVSSSIYKIPSKYNIIVKRTPYKNLNECSIYKNIKNFTYTPIYYGEFNENGINYLFLEYLDPRNDWEPLNKFDLDTYKQVISALKGLHQEGIYHRDLNALNIMINNITNEIKFIDFEKSVNNNMIDNLIIKVKNERLTFYSKDYFFFLEDQYYKVCTEYLKLLQDNNTIIDNKDSLKEILKRNDFLELGFLFLSSITDYFEDYENLFHIQENNNEPITEIIWTQENILEIIEQNFPEFLSIFEEYFMNKNPYIEEFELLNNEQNKRTLLPPKKR